LPRKPPHFAPKAKRVIFLLMHGGPSSIDTFDPKPRLERDNGKPVPFKRGLTFARDSVRGLMKPLWNYKQYGQSGIAVSDLFPNVGACADDLCVVRSMVGDGVDHGAAMLQLHTGVFSFKRPSMGSWVLYGLGTENQDLPGFGDHQARPGTRRAELLELQLPAQRLPGHRHRQLQYEGGGDRERAGAIPDFARPSC